MLSHQRVLGMGVRWSDLCFKKAQLAVVEKGLFICVSKTPPIQSRHFDSNMQASHVNSDTIPFPKWGIPGKSPLRPQFLKSSCANYRRWVWGAFLEDNLPHTFWGEWIGSFRTNGTGPTKNIHRTPISAWVSSWQWLFIWPWLSHQSNSHT